MLVALMSYSRPMQLVKLLQQFLDAIAAEHMAPSGNVMSYLESIGVVESPIRIGKRGRVRLCGVYWFARSSSDRIIAIDENIKVIGREGNTLLVEPVDVPERLNLGWPDPQVKLSS